MANTASDQLEQYKLASVTSATAQTVTFSAAVQEVYVNGTQPMHVAFNASPATGSNYLLPASGYERFVFSRGNINTVSVIADGATGDVYVMGVRG